MTTDSPLARLALTTKTYRRRFPASPLFAVAIIMAIGARGVAADVEQDARALEGMLIAPCCFTQQVSIHHSPAANDVRRDIRRRLAAGETQAQIRDAYVKQYGKRVLAEPPAEGIANGLYLLPPVVFLLTGALVVVTVRRFAAPRPSEASSLDRRGQGAEDSYGVGLDEQLRDLD